VVVAIIGAGHCPGIKRYFDADIDQKALEMIPPPGLARLLVKWTVPVLLLLLLVYSIYTAGYEVAGRYLWVWCLVAAFYGAFGCLVSATHPFTALFTVLTAPFTMLVPVFKPGLFAAIIETCLRRPRVLDMERVLEDMVNVRGWYTNRVAHVFLIFLVNNLTKWLAFGTLGLLGLVGVVH
jgi:pheromone shutdown protein TraB